MMQLRSSSRCSEAGRTSTGANCTPSTCSSYIGRLALVCAECLAVQGCGTEAPITAMMVLGVPPNQGSLLLDWEVGPSEVCQRPKSLNLHTPIVAMSETLGAYLQDANRRINDTSLSGV
jgi:hypothetical protein